MDKNIIIDGVNVAGCYWKCKDGDCAMYYADLSADNNELEFGFNCEDNPDCYYKQLKRLEQENKELKQALDKEPLAQKALVIGYSNYKKRVNELYKVLDSYRSALEEIRKILNKECGVISNAKAVGIINEVLG